MRSAKKAQPVFREKLTLRNGLLVDAVIWSVPMSDRYPEGVKYRLALVDPVMGEVWILFDNHFPKGHHRHLRNGHEIPYGFRSIAQLVDDFRQAIQEREAD